MLLKDGITHTDGRITRLTLFGRILLTRAYTHAQFRIASSSRSVHGKPDNFPQLHRRHLPLPDCGDAVGRCQTPLQVRDTRTGEIENRRVTHTHTPVPALPVCLSVRRCV